MDIAEVHLESARATFMQQSCNYPDIEIMQVNNIHYPHAWTQRKLIDLIIYLEKALKFMVKIKRRLSTKSTGDAAAVKF